ncbi:MAG TPA: PSD1 and planctomycete cytochrome C domain-containing protein [Isosphaeraceae bacterium]|nr:PSD1 and planctomycete cytochrome C domain-containing protein [Isosphaeraceae bacterium]
MRTPSRSWGKLAAVPALVGMVALTVGSASAAGPGAKVDYNRDVRPILSDTCYACHGPDAKARKAELRLDQKEDAFRDRDGYAVIVPGDVEASELVQRIKSEDENEVMPPPMSRKKLTPAQVDTLERWVAQGAGWKEHWAFKPPEKAALPEVRGRKWPRNPIDQFILARLEAEGLAPSPEADKTTLIRRLTLTLTGLPPTPADVDAFLADSSPSAYEKVVDRLLSSPHYGEQMARVWLDAARYGDTHGLHLDNYREMWPYRDWVIKAFNTNTPYDQFLVEQLAGDLLPDPSLDQLVASGFNRCHVTTNEGGSIEEEVYVRNVIDRVDTTGTVFLGLTVACARCHDHKYDPITTKNFYQLFAIFNSLDDSPMDGNAARYPPIVQVPSAEQKADKERLEEKLASIRKLISAEVAKVSYDDAQDAALGEYVERSDYVWVDDAVPAGAQPTTEGKPGKAWSFVTRPEHPVLSGEKSLMQRLEGQGQHAFMNAKPGLRVGEGDILFAYVFIDPTNPPKELMLEWHSDGWKHRAYWGENLIDYGTDGTTERVRVGSLPITGKWVRIEVEAAKVGLKPGTMLTGAAFTQHGGTVYWDKAGIETWTPQDGQTYDTLTAWVRAQRALKGASLPKPLQEVVKLDRDDRSAEQKSQLRAYFIEHGYSKTQTLLEPLNQQVAQVEKDRKKLDEQIATTLVSHERKEPRPAFLLDRGEYDRRKDPVERGTPQFLPPMPADAPRNRLGFARWLVAPSHPLTARVEVNRLWQQCFGTGIVKTTEDFGFQGEPPSHPELLDWLAVQFREDGWDVRTFLKRMVMSATFRQSSHVTKDRLAKDSSNRLLSRGPRFRLDAEMLRDQALAAGGLLVERTGGPSVKPPQPGGLWEAVGYTSSNTAKFVADKGHEKVHRRSMYTFWKRTSPPPQMTNFDAPSRESCIVRRERTNTPLQALELMNEPQFVEAARALAARALREGGSTPEDRVTYLFRLTTARLPDERELAELVAVYNDHHAVYASNVDEAKRLVAVGESKPDPALCVTDLAASTMVANLILNLDEVINLE